MYRRVGVLQRRSWCRTRHGLCASSRWRSSSSSAYCLDLVRLERRATAYCVRQSKGWGFQPRRELSSVRILGSGFTHYQCLRRHHSATLLPVLSWKEHRMYTSHSENALKVSTLRPPLMEFCMKYDHEHYLCCLLLPREARAASFALRAFNVEVAQVKDVVSDKKLGEMRMQFWRDTIDQTFKGAPPQHPVAEELAQAIHRHKLSKHWFTRLLDSREADLSTTMYLSTGDMEDYAERTSSSLLYLTLEAMGVKDVNVDHAASHVGKAEGIVTVLRAVAYHRSRRAVLIPMDIIMRHGASQEDFLRANPTQAVKDSVFDFASLAHTHLLKARSLRSQLPAASNSSKAMLPATVCGSFLRRIQRAQFDPFDPKLTTRDPLLAYKLLWKKIHRDY